MLVTGAAGLIGSHLCDRLPERGEHVPALMDAEVGEPLRRRPDIGAGRAASPLAAAAWPAAAP